MIKIAYDHPKLALRVCMASVVAADIAIVIKNGVTPYADNRIGYCHALAAGTAFIINSKVQYND